MVLIDRAGRELSNGGHVVFLSNLEISCGNLAPEPDLGSGSADHFLTLFLTETICKKSTNEADCTSNR